MARKGQQEPTPRQHCCSSKSRQPTSGMLPEHRQKARRHSAANHGAASTVIVPSTIHSRAYFDCRIGINGTLAELYVAWTGVSIVGADINSTAALSDSMHDAR